MGRSAAQGRKRKAPKDTESSEKKSKNSESDQGIKKFFKKSNDEENNIDKKDVEEKVNDNQVNNDNDVKIKEIKEVNEVETNLKTEKIKDDEKAKESDTGKDVDSVKKVCSNGKEWNLKISSWNMNGIRAWTEHGGLDFIVKEDPDIFCCQETKCDKSKIPPKVELKNYHCYWLSGDKQGYSGVGLMSKIKPIKVSYGINDAKFDSEGRVITAEYEKFFLINSYIPNSGRGLPRLPFRLEWEAAFLKFIKDLDKQKPVVWCGDLNVAHNKIDLKNPDSNAKTAGFTKEERECFTKLLAEGFIDSFRYLYPTKEGAYTYWNYFNKARENNVGWRLDYFVLSERLKSQLGDCSMRPSEKGSDHCPIVLEILI